jgi:glycosyltransferase involved in cell wall biosynthesis
MVSKGITVFAFASDYTEATKMSVVALGAIPIDYKMSRAGMNPISDFFYCIQLSIKLRKLHLDSTLAYFIKPVIYGTLAAFFAMVPNRFAMIEGAGYIFTSYSNPSLLRRLLRICVTWLYKISLSKISLVFMLNYDDKKLFVNEGMVIEDKIRLINGIGVELDYYHFLPSVSDPLCFILVARLLREKGIYEYVEAARKIRYLYPETRFLLLGNVDDNPGSILESEAKAWVKEGVVEWPGQVADVRHWLAQASVFVLPSYREGLPRSTQEAMSMGRPVITTDVPGCRETVQHGLNGFVVPPCNSAALFESMLNFIKHPHLVEVMGLASRNIAENNFDVHKINAKILNSMQSF